MPAPPKQRRAALLSRSCVTLTRSRTTCDRFVKPTFPRPSPWADRAEGFCSISATTCGTRCACCGSSQDLPSPLY